MKISKPLVTLSEYKDFQIIENYFSNYDIKDLSEDELKLFRDYFYLLNVGAQCTGAMTESKVEEIFENVELIEETFADDIVAGNANALKSASGTIKSVATVLGAAGLAAGGYLYWKLKTKKAKKLVDAENQVKVKMSKERVASHKAKEGLKSAYAQKSEKLTGKELDKARKAKNSQLSKESAQLKQKLDLHQKHLDKLKDITDTYIKMKSGSDSDTNESFVNEAFSGSEWIANWIRKRRLQGDIDAKEIEMEILSPSQKEITQDSVKKLDQKIADLDKREKEEQAKAEANMSEEDKKKEKEVGAKLDDIKDDITQEEPKEEKEKSTGAVEKVKSLVSKIRQLKTGISKVVEKQARVQKIASDAKERKNEKLMDKSSDLLIKYREQISEMQKEIQRIKDTKIAPIRDKATGSEKREISDLLSEV